MAASIPVNLAVGLRRGARWPLAPVPLLPCGSAWGQQKWRWNPVPTQELPSMQLDVLRPSEERAQAGFVGSRHSFLAYKCWERIFQTVFFMGRFCDNDGVEVRGRGLLYICFWICFLTLTSVLLFSPPYATFLFCEFLQLPMSVMKGAWLLNYWMILRSHTYPTILLSVTWWH